jgi:cytochrome c oxidase subunit 4
MSDAVIDQKTIAIETERYHHHAGPLVAAITGVEIVLIFLPSRPRCPRDPLLLSAVKFFAVIPWFMHLIYDARLLFWLFFAGLALAFATFTAVLVDVVLDRSYRHEVVRVRPRPRAAGPSCCSARLGAAGREQAPPRPAP